MPSGDLAAIQAGNQPLIGSKVAQVAQGFGCDIANSRKSGLVAQEWRKWRKKALFRFRPCVYARVVALLTVPLCATVPLGCATGCFVGSVIRYRLFRYAERMALDLTPN